MTRAHLLYFAAHEALKLAERHVSFDAVYLPVLDAARKLLEAIEKAERAEKVAA